MIPFCLAKDDARSAQGSARFQRAAFGILPSASAKSAADAFRQDAEMDELEARAPHLKTGRREG